MTDKGQRQRDTWRRNIGEEILEEAEERIVEGEEVDRDDLSSCFCPLCEPAPSHFKLFLPLLWQIAPTPPTPPPPPPRGGDYRRDPGLRGGGYRCAGSSQRGRGDDGKPPPHSPLYNLLIVQFEGSQFFFSNRTSSGETHLVQSRSMSQPKQPGPIRRRDRYALGTAWNGRSGHG